HPPREAGHQYGVLAEPTDSPMGLPRNVRRLASSRWPEDSVFCCDGVVAMADRIERIINLWMVLHPYTSSSRVLSGGKTSVGRSHLVWSRNRVIFSRSPFAPSAESIAITSLIGRFSFRVLFMCCCRSREQIAICPSKTDGLYLV